MEASRPLSEQIAAEAEHQAFLDDLFAEVDEPVITPKELHIRYMIGQLLVNDLIERDQAIPILQDWRRGQDGREH